MSTPTSPTTVSPPEVSLTVVNGQVMASSLDVASKFGKNHKDVLKAISNLEIPDDYRGRNFALSSYLFEMPNGGKKEMPMVEMTRDGFTLLGMGFTGKEAMKWKITYINAFNAMEAELTRPTILPWKRSGEPPQTAPSELIDNADRFAAYKRMAEIAGFDGNQATFSANSAMVRNHCFDPLATLGVTHLIADNQEQDLTPTLIGVELGNLTPRQVNKLLIGQNFQLPITDPAGRVVSYTPTEKGKPFSIFKDTKRKHGDGTPVKQLLWRVAIVKELKEVAA